MDERRFDRLSAILGAATPRRAGLTSLFAALAGASAATTLPDRSAPAGNAATARTRKHLPSPAGACGNRSRKDNDCCTGICDISVGKKNLDGNGRCRCVRKGGACSANRNCCRSSLKCVDGVYLFAAALDTSLTLQSGVVITGNTAAAGSGVAVKALNGGTATITGASTSNIYGNNTGVNCEEWDGSAWQPVVSCAF